MARKRTQKTTAVVSEILNLSRAEAIIRRKFNVPDDARLGWHFVPKNKKLRYGDGRLVEVGKTLSVTDGQEPMLCSYGMHASPTPRQAMEYMPHPAPHLCLVWVQGQIDEGDDKFCGAHRHCLAMVDYETFVVAREQYEAVERTAREQYEAVERTAREQYEAVERPAREQYEAVERTAREQYEAVERPAREQYEALKRTAREQYEALKRPAREQYEAVERPAWEQYEAVERPAWEQYEAVERPAWEQYEAVERPAREQYEALKRPAREQYEAVERPAWEQMEFFVLTQMGVFEGEALPS